MSWKSYKLGDLCTIEKGNIGITKAIPGDYPLVVLGEERRSHNQYQFDDDAVIIPLVSNTTITFNTMSFTQEDFQKAIRISRAIQEYLEDTGENGARSTDVYGFLARKGLVQRDKDQGLFFRRFLNKLKDANLLSLIPQCKCIPGVSGEFNEWYFYKVVKEKYVPENLISIGRIADKINFPELTESEIDSIIEQEEDAVAKLPKSNREFTPNEKDTRVNFPRAYETWSNEEVNLVRRTFNQFKKVDKVAKLMKRQPSAIENKLKQFGMI
jgi:hypothetical protein